MKRTQKTALKKTGGTAKPKNQPAVVAERPGSWHLARTETERRLCDFEFGLERLAQAYYRWKAACLAAVCDVPLTGDDVAVQACSFGLDRDRGQLIAQGNSLPRHRDGALRH